MQHEMLVGLEVTDDEAYQQYRDAMRPILERHGGGFRYDFKVSEVLARQTDDVINRVFTIHFADRDARERFFAHPEYQRIKADYFEASVGATTIIAEYERPGESS